VLGGVAGLRCGRVDDGDADRDGADRDNGDDVNDADGDGRLGHLPGWR